MVEIYKMFMFYQTYSIIMITVPASRRQTSLRLTKCSFSNYLRFQLCHHHRLAVVNRDDFIRIFPLVFQDVQL